MSQALQLARNAGTDVLPNPRVGCVVVRDGHVVGHGYHRTFGGPHAEVEALATAGVAAKGGTAYVTLEPCNHHGKTGPCTQALIASGVSHVVVGCLDPNPVVAGSGVAQLREAGMLVEVLDLAAARELIEDFAVIIRSPRPYLALKMALSMDGFIAATRGERQTLSSQAWFDRVRHLRIDHDAVLVGAGTVRIDDPLLTVRPEAQRARPFQRIVACETDAVPAHSHIFEAVRGYARTIVLAPAGMMDRFAHLQSVADVLAIGESDSKCLDLGAAVRSLRADRGIFSILCEGGPTLGARCIAERLVDRFHWAIAPRLLANSEAVPVLAGANLAQLKLHAHFDHCDLLGEDVVMSGTFHYV